MSESNPVQLARYHGTILLPIARCIPIVGSRYLLDLPFYSSRGQSTEVPIRATDNHPAPLVKTLSRHFISILRTTQFPSTLNSRSPPLVRTWVEDAEKNA